MKHPSWCIPSVVLLSSARTDGLQASVIGENTIPSVGMLEVVTALEGDAERLADLHRHSAAQCNAFVALRN